MFLQMKRKEEVMLHQVFCFRLSGAPSKRPCLDHWYFVSCFFFFLDEEKFARINVLTLMLRLMYGVFLLML